MLKAVVAQARLETAERSQVRLARDRLKAAYANTEQAAIGDAVYAWFLTAEPKPRDVAEIRNIFEGLRARGESKWYVVYARLALMSAYGREGMNAEAKAVGQEALQLINVEELKQSYSTLAPILKFAFGEEQFSGGPSDMDKWMAAFQAVAHD